MARSWSSDRNFPLRQKRLCSHLIHIFFNIPLKTYLIELFSLYYCSCSFKALIWKVSPPLFLLPGFLVIPLPSGFWFPRKMLSITNDCVLAKCHKYSVFQTFRVALSPFWNSVLPCLTFVTQPIGFSSGFSDFSGSPSVVHPWKMMFPTVSASNTFSLSSYCLMISSVLMLVGWANPQTSRRCEPCAYQAFSPGHFIAPPIKRSQNWMDYFLIRAAPLPIFPELVNDITSSPKPESSNAFT